MLPVDIIAKNVDRDLNWILETAVQNLNPTKKKKKKPHIHTYLSKY